jgi:hypothetical protein
MFHLQEKASQKAIFIFTASQHHVPQVRTSVMENTTGILIALTTEAEIIT